MSRSIVILVALAALAAVLAMAGGAGWRTDAATALSKQQQRQREDAAKAKAAADVLATLRTRTIPASVGPVSVDIDAMRHAVQFGEISVLLDDRTRYPVRIESEKPEFGGRSTFIGRVETRFGTQTAVLTFGRGAVFGVLPMPDGRKLSVSTTKGVVGFAVAGGIIPPGMEDQPVSDFAVLGQDGRPIFPVVRDAKAPGVGAQPRVGERSGQVRFKPWIAHVDAVPLPEVRIDLLGLYGDDLVDYRGDVATAETEVISQVAIAYQAHVDSGSRVRFSLVGLHHIEIPAGNKNQEVFSILYENRIKGLDLPRLRDSLGADLVFVLRPYLEGDSTCGVGTLSGPSQNRANFDDQLAYSVGNVGPCGPYTLAHELGHNLGAMHDRLTDSPDGTWGYGAYPYSFGYARCPGNVTVDGVATIMAYRGNHGCGNEWLGYFSNPDLVRCDDLPCGEVDRADNVRGFNRSASAVAAFRGKPGTLSVADIEELETPVGGTRWISVPIRLSGVAPPGGVTFRASIVGGTATAGADYKVEPVTTLSIAAGERSAKLNIAVLPDDEVEGDETILVHIDGVNAAVDDADAIVTIADDDPRLLLRGALRFPKDSQPPEAIPVTVLGANGTFDAYEIKLLAPDFRYAIPVVAGSGVRLMASPPAPFTALLLNVGQVFTDVQQDYDIPFGLKVTGRIRLPQGGPPLAKTIEVQVAYTFNCVESMEMNTTPDAGGIFSFLVPPGVNLKITATPESHYLPYRKIIDPLTIDLTSDILLSTEPSLSVWHPSCAHPEATLGARRSAAVWFELSAPAPPGGVTLHYQTSPGTAMPGTDYVSLGETIGFAEGSTRQTVVIDFVNDDVAEDDEYFYVDVDRVIGAVLEEPRSRIDIQDDDRPPPQPIAMTLSGSEAKSEGDFGTRNVFHAVVRLAKPAPDAGVAFAYRTVDGTALGGEDFAPMKGTVTFAPGEAATTIDIILFGDNLVEPDEYFDFVVTPIRGATLASPALRFDLLNDDRGQAPEEPKTPAPPARPPVGAPPLPIVPPQDDRSRCVDALRGGGTHKPRAVNPCL